MSAKKREIYARAATQLRSHDRAVRAELACPGAMGLYLWMLLQARGEETGGDVLEAAAIASWGAPVAFRRKQVEALILVGLIIRDRERLVIVKYLEHNDGPEDISAAREATRERVQAHRRRRGSAPAAATDVTSYERVQNAHVPISCSSSLSDLESRSEEPTSSPRAEEPAAPPASGPGLAVVRPLAAVPDPERPPPPWWPEVLATVHAQVGVLLASGECWLAYAGHRAGKRLPATRPDALQWLVQVMVPKARKAAEDARRTRERDATFAAERKAAQTPAAAPYHATAKRPKDPPRMAPEDAVAALGTVLGALAPPKLGTGTAE